MTNTGTNSVKVNLDMGLALWLLRDIKPFTADRPLSKIHAAQLASEMRLGRFLPEITTIMVATLGETTYRLNGQHTATAVLEVANDNDNENFTLPGVTLLTFNVENEAELRQLYARIDRGASRTNRDVVISLLSGVSEFDGINDRVLKLLPLGLAYMRFEEPQKRKLYSGESAALDVLGEYLSLSQTIAGFLNELQPTAIHHGHMFRGPVAAALYATFAVDADDAARFWQAVATGVGFESEAEPAARLRQTLKNVSIGGGMIQRGSKGVLGAENLYRACLHSWNRFRSGGEFKVALRPTVLTSRPTVK